MARGPTYAMRLQMIRNVIAGIQAYWSQLFLLSQKVKLIEVACGSYLWLGEAKITKNTLVTWDKVCMLKGQVE